LFCSNGLVEKKFHFWGMFKRLKEKWKVSWLQFVLIFCTFALGGSLCAKLGRWLLELVHLENTVVYYIIYIPLITLFWPICVLVVSIPLGQFNFFKNYLLRVWGKIYQQPKTHQIAIFASGTGSNAAKIMEYFKNNPTINVALIVTNNPNAGVLAIAEKNRIPTLIIDKEQFFWGDAYVAALEKAGINFIVLAGFLWKIPETLTTVFNGKMVNIHPALLPKYGGKGMYGHLVHEAVLTNKEQETGITIHFVNEKYDDGKVIFQAMCKVEENDTADTLAQRIHGLEHEHYPKVIEKILLK
jgi:formyltetrahydrofolate-dependent phosphoribosylglycinamide formyltransferase